jgi:sulfite reductase alpha subunit-like flavoprotein
MPNAGVAPIRAILQERQALCEQLHQVRHEGITGAHAGNGVDIKADLAPCCLFFGCRSATADYYYAQEWLAMQCNGILAPPPLGIVTAFSRDGSSKVRGTVMLNSVFGCAWL